MTKNINRYGLAIDEIIQLLDFSGAWLSNMLSTPFKNVVDGGEMEEVDRIVCMYEFYTMMYGTTGG